MAVAVLSPITAEMNRLMADPGAIDAILKRGAEKANAIAKPNLRQVYELVGFLAP
jgi:tryptophanyl-tRNA synthetase